MTNISAVDAGAPGRAASSVDSTSRTADRAGLTTPAPRTDDRAEISTVARLLSRLRALPDVRQELIDEVRAKITAGDYDTPEKLDRALDEMIRDAEDDRL